MLNHRTIQNALGQLLFVEAVMLTACLGVGIVYHESDYLPFGLSALVALVLGLLLRAGGRGSDGTMGRRDGYIVVTLCWVLFSFVGTLPFLLSGAEPRPSAAFFETMSGFTTTGATALSRIDDLPHSILFWRSLMHWVGGVGIIFFMAALLPQMDMGGQKMFAAETTGLKISKLHPRFATTAHWLGGLYFVMTAVCAVAYYLAGMGPFDALNHAMSTMSTGGSSTHAASIAWFHSPALEWVVVVFMFLGGVNFTLLFLLIVKRRLRPLRRDGEFRVYVGLLTCVALFCALSLFLSQGRGLPESLRVGFFHVTALMTTTGFTTENFMSWPVWLWMPLMFVTAIGACAGSTSGGIKIVRLLAIWKVTTREFRRMLHPRAVFPIRVNGTLIDNNLVRSIFVFFVCYFALTFVGTILMMCMGISLLDSVSCCITALSNVGPGIGYMVGPLDSYAAYPDGALWINAFLMLAGRLEIFAVLLVFVPEFWRKS
ncbi:MAG: TrkH family potassium uptake protein [Alloprevotella sp.]|nr:TrkH family potassium uptake protein [Alloprevotella sp.]